MRRFQYRIVNLGFFKVTEQMVNAFGFLGESGWELVTVYDKSSNWASNMEKGFAIFKREVLDGDHPDGKWALASNSEEFRHLNQSGLPENSPYNDPAYGAW
jgi:hypothetical protein